MSYLELFNVVEAAAVRDDGEYSAVHLLASIRRSAQDVLETLQSHRDNLGILHRQQTAQRRDDAGLSQVQDLIGGATGSGVGHRPGRLLLNIELGALEQLDQFWEDASVDDDLDLVGGAGRDVADCPARLLANVLLWVV